MIFASLCSEKKPWNWTETTFNYPVFLYALFHRVFPFQECILRDFELILIFCIEILQYYYYYRVNF